MELFRGKMLINQQNSKVPVDMAFKGKSLIILFFSSLWCKPSVEFLPALRDLYETAAAQKIPLEVVYVSLDQKSEDIMNHFKNDHGNWLAIPHGDEIILILQHKYGITSIPKAIVLSATGRVITLDGYKEILDKGRTVLSSWVSPYN